MNDILGRLASFLLSAIVLFIVPIMLIAVKQDDTKQTIIDDAVVEFVDNARASGQITAQSYQRMCTKVDSAQEACKIDINYDSAISYSVPVDKNGNRIPTDQYGNVSSSYTGAVFYQTVSATESYNKDAIIDRIYNVTDAKGDPDYSSGTAVARDPAEGTVPFELREGGYLTVTVQNTAPTMGTKFVRLFIPFYEGKTLLSSYSGYVGNTRQK